jgi:hypothetical protein
VKFVSHIPPIAVPDVTIGPICTTRLDPAVRGVGHFDPGRAREGTGRDGSSAGNPADHERQSLTGAVGAVAEALQAKDAYTRSHSARVSAYAAAVAQELGMSKREVDQVKLAAQLHDVGKIGVPDDLLCKEGPLTDEERRRFMWHTVIGEQILRPLFQDRPGVLAAVRWHHERMDGHGFPDGLTGDHIPLSARIIAVADTFDAMTTTRPYRTPLPLLRVVRELKRVAGSQLDPRCVGALLSVLCRQPRLIPVAMLPGGAMRQRLAVWLVRQVICGRGSPRIPRRLRAVRGSSPCHEGAARGPPAGGRPLLASSLLRTL